MATVPPQPDTQPDSIPDTTPRPDEVSPPPPDFDQPDPSEPGGDGGQDIGLDAPSSRVGEQTPDEVDEVGSIDEMEGVTGSQAGTSR